MTFDEIDTLALFNALQFGRCVKDVDEEKLKRSPPVVRLDFALFRSRSPPIADYEKRERVRGLSDGGD